MAPILQTGFFMRFIGRFLTPSHMEGFPAVGIFFLRLFAGSALMLHGQDKIKNPFNWMGDAVPGFLQALAALSEFGGGLAILFGLLTPLACLGVMSTMFVAVLMHLTNDVSPTYFVKPGPKVPGDAYESALGYFVMALTIFLTGPGKLSLDAAIFNKLRK